MRATRTTRGRRAAASAGWTTSTAILLVLGSWAGACSADGSDDDDDGAGATGAGATGAGTTGSGATGPGGSSTGGSGNATQGGSAGTGGSSSGGGGGSVVAVPLCQPACGDVTDCNFGTPNNDQDNYSCSDGYCHYEGCNSDAECQAVGMLCDENAVGAPTCGVQCSTPADCSTFQPPFDEDNYSCPQDVCVYEGCNSDAECQAIGNYVCRDSGFGLAVCMPSCTVVGDCPMSGMPYDQDNYACTDGYCAYTGCNSDAECQTLGDYVCR